MESWPVMDGMFSGVFALEIGIDAQHAGTPIKGFSVTMFAQAWSIFVSWGDGTADRYINETFVDPQHTYNSPGTYTLLYVGIPHWAGIPTTGWANIAPFVKKVLTPFPRLREEQGLPTLQGADKMTEICDNLYTNARYLDSPLTWISNLFEGCASLTEVGNSVFSGVNMRADGQFSILDGLFRNASALRSVGDIFHGYGFTGVTEVYSIFAGCTALKNISEGVFRTMPNVRVMSGCFSNSGLLDIPPGLFSRQADLERAGKCFSGTNITTIPPGLFSHNPNLTSVAGCFSWTKITTIPEDLFSQCPNIEDFEGCFEGCSDIVGNVPALWEQYPDANGDACFRGCVNAANYDDIPLEWRRREI